MHIGRNKFREWEREFIKYGTIGLLPELTCIELDPRLEKLVILIKTSRPHESATLALRLAHALGIGGASLELIREIQRCYGYGQNLDQRDIQYFSALQHIISSVVYHKEKKNRSRLQRLQPPLGSGGPCAL
jgi:hypothetical protein